MVPYDSVTSHSTSKCIDSYVICMIRFIFVSTNQIGEKRAALRGFRRLQNSLKPPEGEGGEGGGSGIGGDYLRAAKGPGLNDVCKIYVTAL